MKKDKLDIYKISMMPIKYTPKGQPIVLPPRGIIILAQSEAQAKKFLKDWMIGVRHQNYFIEMCEKVNIHSKEAKEFLHPFTIEERLESQMKTIYGKGEH